MTDKTDAKIDKTIYLSIVLFVSLQNKLRKQSVFGTQIQETTTFMD